MPSKYRIYPYKMGSKSARALATALQGWQVYPDRRFPARADHRIINWGNSTLPVWAKADTNILNNPRAVARATNKLDTLNILREHNIPCIDFTCDRQTALEWLSNGHIVYCRTILNGHSGQGIVIAENPSQLVNARLYTKGLLTKAEYRIHVFNGKVIDYIKKRRAIEDEPTLDESRIRSHSNGWIFTRENLKRLDRVEELAINAIKTMGLDFGAVDIIRDSNNNCFVVEINTACGLENSTIEKYTEAIINHFENYES